MIAAHFLGALPGAENPRDGAAQYHGGAGGPGRQRVARLA
jgi:hypothetical protein